MAQKETWMTPIIRTVQGEQDNQDRKELAKPRYTFLEGVLYRKGFLYPLLRCLSPPEVEYVMREIHKGIYCNHLGGRLLAQKIFRQGYYWPIV
ncbi:protein NYNRIN-like [Gossypium australe]|uniref:Protein NYNRIN-like n=1 Tax=Gossypium australe TaxID=47621 RepID=A0A5B6V9N7_9ROSI|nr:protein NYNRIN-like [Gossypium australe]